jgi:predicted dehydrogenase
MTTIGLVGCAHIHTPGFVNRIKAKADVKVSKVWDPNRARSDKRAADLQAAVVDDPAAIFTDREISAVVICSETNRHQELVAAAAKAKKAMFVEKPLGMAAKDSFAMAKSIAKAGVPFSTGYFMRGNPIHLFLKDHVDRGTFGKITRARGSNCHSGALGDWFKAKPENPADDWRWMADPALSGVGGFGDLGTHMLDILIWLLGDVELATAQISTGINRYDNNGTFCDEFGEGLMKFKNGALGTLAASWDDVANPVSLLISGTDAHATVVNGKLYFKCEKLGLKGEEPHTDLPQPALAGFDSWLAAVAGDTGAKLVTIQEAAYRPAVMEAMYEGSQKGKWVKPKSLA